MARPTTKQALLYAATENYHQLQEFISIMTEKELETPFDFSKDSKKKEAHWQRDKNLRDVLIHLYEWQQLLLKWIEANLQGEDRPFLPAPYNWKSYGEMNKAFWQAHQATSLATARALLEESHTSVLKLLDGLTDEQLFTKGIHRWTGTTTLGSYCVSATSSHYDWALKKLKAHRKNCK